MHLIPRQSVYQAARLVALALTSALLPAVLTGCAGVLGNPQSSQVRVIDVSPDAPALDIYQSHNALAYNLGFGTITSYVPVVPGTYTIAANSAGSQQVFSSTEESLLPATQYTVLIGAVADTPQVTLRDQNQPAPSGQVALRFVDQAARTGAVDIYLVPPHQTLADLKPIVTNVAPGGNTGYLDLPIGTYTVVVLPAGTVPTHDAVPLYTGAQIAYADGSARTMILIDQLQIRGYHLQLITADDFDSPGPG